MTGMNATVNEPLPHNLTVGRLRELLREVPDEVVVGLAVPSSLRMEPGLTQLYNVRASYSGGPVLKLLPVEVMPEDRSRNEAPEQADSASEPPH
jgi:hypothetical protein